MNKTTARCRPRSGSAAAVTMVLLVIACGGVQAQEFGRFFTTPEQRARLDNLRTAEPELVVEITDQDLELEEQQPQSPPPINALTIKGLVHRRGGNSTAWINESNTYEGDIASQYITIDEGNIERDKVLLNIAGSASDIEVKVGETYDPDSDKLVDVVQDPASTTQSRAR